MISHGVFAMATRRRLTAFTFGLYPGRIESQFAPSFAGLGGSLTLAPAPIDTFTATAGLSVGGALDVVINYAREDILPVDTFAMGLGVGGALDVVINFLRADVLPVDTFTATAGLSVGGALDVVINYVRLDTRPTDTFTATAGLSVGGILETI